MDVVSISQLKASPSKVIAQAEDYPVAVGNRNKIKAYLLGKDLYEKITQYLEDYLDKQVVSKADFSQGEDFEKVAKSLGI